MEIGNGMAIVPVTDTNQVFDEGRNGINLDGTMGLSVSLQNLIKRLTEGTCHLISVRDESVHPAEWVVLLAMSYDYGSAADYDGNDPRLSILATQWPGIVLTVEAIARGEGEMDRKAAEALLRALDGIAGSTDRIRVPPRPDIIESGIRLVDNTKEGIILAPIERLDREANADSIAGYPIAAPGGVEAAFDAWKPFMPAYIQECDLASLRTMVEMELIDNDPLGRDRFDISGQSKGHGKRSPW